MTSTCTERKDLAQRERIYSEFLQRSQRNHSLWRILCKFTVDHCVMFCCSLKRNPKGSANKHSWKQAQEQPQQLNAQWKVQMSSWHHSVGSQRDLAPKGELLFTGCNGWSGVKLGPCDQRQERTKSGCWGERGQRNQHLCFHRGHDSLSSGKVIALSLANWNSSLLSKHCS